MSNLGPLPEFGIDTASHAGFRVKGYTAEQMRAYAAEAVAQERERCAALCDQLAQEWGDEGMGRQASACRVCAVDIRKG